jgi:hypothetical protein
VDLTKGCQVYIGPEDNVVVSSSLELDLEGEAESSSYRVSEHEFAEWLEGQDTTEMRTIKALKRLVAVLEELRMLLLGL